MSLDLSRFCDTSTVIFVSGLFVASFVSRFCDTSTVIFVSGLFVASFVCRFCDMSTVIFVSTLFVASFVSRFCDTSTVIFVSGLFLVSFFVSFLWHVYSNFRFGPHFGFSFLSGNGLFCNAKCAFSSLHSCALLRFCDTSTVIFVSGFFVASFLRRFCDTSAVIFV